MQDLVMTLRYSDGSGIVRALTEVAVPLGDSITECQQFTSVDAGWFFTCTTLVGPTCDELMGALRPAMEGLSAEFDICDTRHPTHTLLLASKAGHYLSELLFRRRTGALPIDVVDVTANHEVLGSLTDFRGVPFAHQVVIPETKADFETEVRRVIRERKVGLVIPVRYIQILSPELCDHLTRHAINIHHSFLPGLKGTDFYRQAHIRGAKLINVAVHFVTNDLDEGPTIEQNVARVDHTMGVSKLVSKGGGQESKTLAEAVRLFAEHRVLMDGSGTVIFR